MEPVAEEQELAEVEEGEKVMSCPLDILEKNCSERTVLKINLTLEDRLGVFKPTNSVTEAKINALSMESERKLGMRLETKETKMVETRRLVQGLPAKPNLYRLKGVA